jgi:hypothetical protein
MVLFECYSRCLLLSQQIRFLHRSTILLARGIRRSNEPLPPLSFTHSGKDLSVDDDSNQMSIQEQFARLELQRLEQESKKPEDESSSFIDEDNPDEQSLSRPSIDPSTTSIILFPGQGTQFIGMG